MHIEYALWIASKVLALLGMCRESEMSIKSYVSIQFDELKEGRSELDVYEKDKCIKKYLKQ